MLRCYTILILLFMFATLIRASARVEYIMALKSPVTEKTYLDARKDIESVGGHVLYEFKAAFKAIQISLPIEHINTLYKKPYCDFIEEDKSVYIYDE